MIFNGTVSLYFLTFTSFVEVGAGHIAGHGEAKEGNGSSTGKNPEHFWGILVNNAGFCN